MNFAARQLTHYPAPLQRRVQLGLVVLITVALYYALYVGAGVTPLVMQDLHISFGYLVGLLALANALGAFASLLAGFPTGSGARTWWSTACCSSPCSPRWQLPRCIPVWPMRCSRS